LGIHPVVVGGMAMYFWTASEEFVIYDIDVVMAVPDELGVKLGELGFIRASDGRARAATHRVSIILDAVRKLADDLEAGGASPDSGELHQIAQEGLRAEYHPKQP
jgi:hypothetical protein